MSLINHVSLQQILIVFSPFYAVLKLEMIGFVSKESHRYNESHQEYYQYTVKVFNFTGYGVFSLNIGDRSPMSAISAKF